MTAATAAGQYRRTSLLSQLSPAERRAFLQEELDQAQIFRQIACARNGVPGFTGRNVIPPAASSVEPSLVPEGAASPPAGVPVVSPKRFWTAAKVATAVATGGTAAIAAAAAALWAALSGAAPAPDGSSADSSAESAAVQSVQTDQDLLRVLESRGAGPVRTPLGEATLRAFQENPDLRRQVLDAVRDSVQSSGEGR